MQKNSIEAYLHITRDVINKAYKYIKSITFNNLIKIAKANNTSTAYNCRKLRATAMWFCLLDKCELIRKELKNKLR